MRAKLCGHLTASLESAPCRRLDVRPASEEALSAGAPSDAGQVDVLLVHMAERGTWWCD